MGWDTQATQKPTAFMRLTKFAGVMVLKVGDPRQLAPPLSPVQQPYLLALGVPATSCTAPPSGERAEDGQGRSHKSSGCQRRGGQTARDRAGGGEVTAC